MHPRTVVTKVRRCGMRKPGSVYVVGGDGGSQAGVLALFTPLDPPVPYPAKSHRTARIVDGIALLDLWQPEKGILRLIGGYGMG